jgi:hypothetical protein
MDTNSGGHVQVDGELDPGKHVIRFHGHFVAGDNHPWSELFEPLFECLKPSSLNLGVWTLDLEARCNRLPVGAVSVLKGYKYAYVAILPSWDCNSAD